LEGNAKPEAQLDFLDQGYELPDDGYQHASSGDVASKWQRFDSPAASFVGVFHSRKPPALAVVSGNATFLNRTPISGCQKLPSFLKNLQDWRDLEDRIGKYKDRIPSKRLHACPGTDPVLKKKINSKKFEVCGFIVTVCGFKLDLFFIFVRVKYFSNWGCVLCPVCGLAIPGVSNVVAHVERYHDDDATHANFKRKNVILLDVLLNQFFKKYKKNES